MTALILVVDDLEPNVKLLEAKLAAEYYDVISASDGYGAIARSKEAMPDLILLDVMMPGMNGFEACRQIKADPKTAHIPIVMVTALSEPSDRVQGLQAGADDFLTKPINDVQLLARVRSLVRMKQLIDELRLRGQTSADIGEVTGMNLNELSEVAGSHVLIVDDDVVQAKNIVGRLSEEQLQATIMSEPERASEFANAGDYDLVIVNTQLMEVDGLRLCSQFRSSEHTRHLPQIILVEEDDQRTLIKGLEMGVNDYLISPVDLSEMACRVRTNIRRKKYQDALKNSYKKTVNMAIKDNLTGLYNRHYLNAHLQNMASSSMERAKPFSVMMMDMDHFKKVNDTYGHDAGDEVLVQLAERIVSQLRSSDLVARFGGEEFVVLLPGCPLDVARDVAERIRRTVEQTPFKITHEVGEITKTVSIGLANLGPDADTTGVSPMHLVERLLKQADEALYACKNAGRNCVTLYAEGLSKEAMVPLTPPAVVVEVAPMPQGEMAAPAAVVAEPVPALPPVTEANPFASPFAPVVSAPVFAEAPTPEVVVAPEVTVVPAPMPVQAEQVVSPFTPVPPVAEVNPFAAPVTPVLFQPVVETPVPLPEPSIVPPVAQPPSFVAHDPFAAPFPPVAFEPAPVPESQPFAAPSSPPAADPFAMSLSPAIIAEPVPSGVEVNPFAAPIAGSDPFASPFAPTPAPVPETFVPLDVPSQPVVVPPALPAVDPFGVAVEPAAVSFEAAPYPEPVAAPATVDPFASPFAPAAEPVYPAPASFAPPPIAAEPVPVAVAPEANPFGVPFAAPASVPEPTGIMPEATPFSVTPAHNDAQDEGGASSSGAVPYAPPVPTSVPMPTSGPAHAAEHEDDMYREVKATIASGRPRTAFGKKPPVSS